MVSNPANGRSVYCQVREIDRNFTTRYNVPKSGRFHLTESDTIVVGQWYRDCLGILKTTSSDNKADLVELKIAPLSALWRWWGSLRAAAHHPDIVVRMGISLGVLGVMLGIIALVPTLLDFSVLPKPCQLPVVLAIAFISTLVGYLACRRPSPTN
jgi:hypothetical protein